MVLEGKRRDFSGKSDGSMMEEGVMDGKWWKKKDEGVAEEKRVERQVEDVI